jgi:N-acyl homoserine lactone hydrolase
MIERLAAGIAAWFALAAMQAPAAPPPLSVWRLDCGTMTEDVPMPSPWWRPAMPVPCFLVRHGTSYMLWDAGMSARLAGNPQRGMALAATLVDQLARIGVKPEQVGFVGISHYHGDHTGQASKFPAARLLIGAGDWAAIKSATPPQGVAPTHFAPWIEGKAPVSALVEDHDIFGDGRVTMLMAPGHTPGHSVLLVKLAGGNLLLVGDLWASHNDVLRDVMPDFNTSRAETLASRERIRRLADKLDATVILHHEAADIAKLPAFPQAAS